MSGFLQDEEQPLYEIKANLFKALAHPVRIRVLEILCSREGPTVVRDILSETGLEATLLSQHLAVLKRHQVVTAERSGNAVFYRVAHPKIPELLRIARVFLTDSLSARRDQLAVVNALPTIGPRP
jgi:DNA-binding transcriptional ArsR family regulator